MGFFWQTLAALWVLLVTGCLLMLIFAGIIRFFGNPIARFLDRLLPNQMRQLERVFPAEAITLETILALSGLILAVFLSLLFSLLASQVWFPDLHWSADPFLIVPLGVLIVTTLAGARYIQDIYALERYRDALVYFIASCYRLINPRVTIDGGRVLGSRFNPIRLIGGPGLVVVQPGNAVMFNELRRPAQFGLVQSVELRRYETIGHIAALDDQHDRALNGEYVTQDGIRVFLSEVNYRYRIIFNPGQERTLQTPFPFDPQALRRMAYNLPMDEQELRNVRFQVRMLVTTAIREYVSTHTIDHLTAPRDGQPNVRDDIRTTVLQNIRTWGLGVTVFMLDVGHFSVAQAVHDTRFNAWAADWIGGAEEQRAYAEGTQRAYEELGRAEAQAELIVSVANALKDAELQGATVDTIRTIFLTRTSMILDAMRENQNEHNPALGLNTNPRRG